MENEPQNPTEFALKLAQVS